MNGVQFVAETYRSGFQKKDQGEDGDYIFFRKSLSQTFSLMRLDFYESPRFPFFDVVSSPHNRQLGTHTGSVEGKPEAPDSKTLPQWTLNLRVYTHM